MIEAIEKNLERGVKLLNNISDDEYSNSSIPPYFSSIGCHMRHILDVFSCVLEGYELGEIDLIKRKKNELAEQKISVGLSYFDKIITDIKLLSEKDLNTKITITDDLGLCKVTSSSTLGAVLMQVQSHTTHHYASIGYIIYQLNIALPDADFGYNPTTIKNS